MKKILGIIICVLLLASFASFAGTKEDALEAMKTARGKLVALLDTKDAGTQKVLIDEIHKATDDANAKLDAYIADAATPADAKAKATEAKTVWGEFVNTREAEIIPAVQAGTPEKGKEIATGIQKDRFKKIVELLQ